MNRLFYFFFSPFLFLGLRLGSSGNSGHTSGLCSGFLGIALGFLIGVAFYLSLIGTGLYFLLR